MLTRKLGFLALAGMSLIARCASAQQSQSITFAPLANRIYGAAPFTVSATASSGLTVRFNSQTKTICKVSGTTVTLVSVGACTVQATQAGNGTYAAATPVNQSFLVAQDSQTITFGALPNQTIGATPFTVGATASSGLKVIFNSQTAPACKVSGSTVTLISVGVCTVQATQAGDIDYAAAASVNQSFQVLSQAPGGWPYSGYDLNNSRWASGETVLNNQNVGGLTVLWQFTTQNDVSATPAVDSAGGYVYFPDFSGYLYKLNAATGAIVWTHNMTDYGLGPTVMSRTTPTLYGTMVIVGASAPLTSPSPSGSYLLALNSSDGSLIWIAPLDPNPNSVSTGSPIIYNGVAYVGVSSHEEQIDNPTFRGSLAAISLANGQILWQTYFVPSGYTGSAVWSTVPVIDTVRSQIYVTTGNDYQVPESVEACEQANKGNATAIAACQAQDNYEDSVVALDLATGSVKWAHKCSTDDAWINSCAEQNKAGCPDPAGQDYDFGAGVNLFWANINGVPTQVVGAGQKSGVYWALQPSNGSRLWSTTVGPGGLLGGIEWSPASDNQRIYVAIANYGHKRYTLQPSGVSWNGGSWAALDAATGAILWQVPDPGFSTITPGQPAMSMGSVTVAIGVVYAGSMSGYMYALDAATGATLWSFLAPGSVNSAPAVVNGTLYWGTGYQQVIKTVGTASNTFYAFSLPAPNAKRK
jgi:polyvinyl alcohol dehydrogenase (cytochrome)